MLDEARSYCIWSRASSCLVLNRAGKEWTLKPGNLQREVLGDDDASKKTRRLKLLKEHNRCSHRAGRLQIRLLQSDMFDAMQIQLMRQLACACLCVDRLTFYSYWLPSRRIVETTVSRFRQSGEGVACFASHRSACACVHSRSVLLHTIMPCGPFAQTLRATWNA